MNKSVTIIIVNYNGEGYLVDCLDSLREQTYNNFHLVIFDNASSDGSVDLISTKYPEVHLIKNDENIGYCLANNYCLKEFMTSQSRYAFLLNADTIMHRKCLERLIRTAEKEKTSGVFSPKILKYPETDKLWYAGGTIDFKRGISHFHIGEYDAAFDHTPGKTEFVSGCSMLVRKEEIEKIGFFDPDFFAYYEDTDFSVRSNRAGMGCYYEPDAIVYHKGGAGYTPHSAYYYYRNRFLFVRKHSTFFQQLYFYPFIIKNQIRHFMKYKQKGEREMAHSIMKALTDGLMNNVGKA